MIDAIAATGDAGDINCWSGIPWHFGRAAMAMGWPAAPWRVPMDRFAHARRWWNVQQLLRGRGPGGYQYSRAFLDAAEALVPPELWPGRVLSFNPHFPRAESVGQRGGKLVHYIDATFDGLCRAKGWADHLPAAVRREAREAERRNYARSERVVTMARWAATDAIRHCGVGADKVTTILPGANLELPEGYAYPEPAGRGGFTRPLVLGFVGKDWRRKGLPFLLQVRTALEASGMPATVRCAGYCPAELQRLPGLEYTGFIDKARQPARFLEFLSACDVGCLFSDHEPLGLSTLEFLRAGVPVTGFAVEGIADTIPPDAGFGFPAGTSAQCVAETLRQTFADEDAVARLRGAARAWSPLVTWERCVEEWRELLTTGAVASPVQPWLGLAGRRKDSHADIIARH